MHNPPAASQVDQPIQPVEQLMRRAARQGGWISAADMRSAGVGRADRERLLKGGIIVREERDIYRLAGVLPNWEDALRAMVRSLDGVACHESAARMWGFDGLPERPFHITVERSCRGVRAPGVVVHTTTRVLLTETATFRGVRVTKPMRTLLDLAGAPIDDDVVARFLEHCIGRQYFALDRLTPILDGSRRRVCTRRLLEIVDRFGGGPVDSAVEAELLRALVRHGFPVPSTQFTIRAQGRFIGRVDFAWPEAQVALELDGYAHHTDSATFVADRDRGNRIVAAGWKLMRTTPARMRLDLPGLFAELASVLYVSP